MLQQSSVGPLSSVAMFGRVFSPCQAGKADRLISLLSLFCIILFHFWWDKSTVSRCHDPQPYLCGPELTPSLKTTNWLYKGYSLHVSWVCEPRVQDADNRFTAQWHPSPRARQHDVQPSPIGEEAHVAHPANGTRRRKCLEQLLRTIFRTNCSCQAMSSQH